jgi:hypothetical protein
MKRASGLKTLSSRQTFLVKFVMPTLLAAFMFLSELSVLLKAHGDPRLWNLFLAGKPHAAWPPQPIMQVVFPLFAVAMLCVMLQYCRIKRVRSDDTNIYVSNYRQELIIPYTDISAVRQNRFISRFATINLRDTSEFGNEIVFMPPLRFLESWGMRSKPHPVIREMNRHLQAAASDLDGAAAS